MTGLLAGGAVLAVLAVLDARTRRVPNRVILTAAAVGLVGAWGGLWAWSWLGAALLGAVVAFAGYPGGDVKGAALCGGFAGPLIGAGAVTLALLATVLLWRAGRIFAPWLCYLCLGYGVVVALALVTGVIPAPTPTGIPAGR